MTPEEAAEAIFHLADELEAGGDWRGKTVRALFGGSAVFNTHFARDLAVNTYEAPDGRSFRITAEAWVCFRVIARQDVDMREYENCRTIDQQCAFMNDLVRVLFHEAGITDSARPSQPSAARGAAPWWDFANKRPASWDEVNPPL